MTKLVSLPARRRTKPRDRLQEALGRIDDAHACWQEGRRAEAVRLMREAVALEEECLGADSVAVAAAYPLLGAYLLMQGDLREAEIVLREAIRRLDAHRDRARERVSARALLAEVHMKGDRPALAEPLLSEALEECAGTFGERSAEYAQLLLGLGSARERQGDLGDAEVLFRRALDSCDRSAGGEAVAQTLQAVLGSLVRVGFATGRQATAVDYLDRLLLTIPDDDEEVIAFDPADDL